MLDWIAGGKPDHPLADPKRARELMAGLPAFDPAHALDELRGWVDSIMHTAGFRLDERLVLLKQLDEAGQSFQRKLLRDYLGAQRLQKLQDALSPTLLDELTGAGALDFQGIESWLIEDISAGGFGALVPEAKPEWIRVGAPGGGHPPRGRGALGPGRRAPPQARCLEPGLYRSGDSRAGGDGGETEARGPRVERGRGGGCRRLPARAPAAGWRGAHGAGHRRPARRRVFPRREPAHAAAGQDLPPDPAGLREGGQDHDIVSYREMLRDDGDNHE